ncbi:tRNA adenylyltransferase [Gleimia coleocanis DSM 15436]|uniref:tRNA adenylyltransferase n=1 Tax=Gleimia coleocanis DSM 15436 TaxID=525245 RepID=C0VXY5_9ACTO|nr:CCA tRNA nucleotidyltransferase [Gleimia coleocanis]EEH64288.1 tRNA adenylyltransferase [Gleimia coleocanis DSM 15436]
MSLQEVTLGVGCLDSQRLLANAKKTFAKLPKEIIDLGHVFAEAGYELALVGGPVRDAFLSLTPHDFDLTTNARPDTTEGLLEKWGAATWAVGKAFGTIGGRKNQLTVEITTYRTEAYEVGSRKPVVEYGDTLEGDLTRRDFTVNACAITLPDLKLVDPHNGLQDLANGVLRTPVSATQSFDDDPLRIMRAARFAAQLGIDVSEDVIAAMEEQAHRLEIVSAERIRAELERLIISPYPRRGLELMVYTGVCDIVLPEFSALRETVDEHNRHKDVYEHTLTVLDRAIALETDADGPVPGPDFTLRFAALMHDIGKPATRKFEADGTVSFHHHDYVGAKMTRKRMKALKFDKQTTEDVSELVKLHLRFHGYGDQSWTDSAVRRYVADAGHLLEYLHRITKADCTTRNRRKALYLETAYADLEKRISELKAQEELDSIRPDLDGSEIMELLGLTPGPEVGKAYKYLLELRMEHGPLGKEKAAELLKVWWNIPQ